LMGGQFGFESELGEGSRFWFTLPSDMKTEAPLQPNADTSATGSSHVLVVEDDPLNRQVVGALLESLGHRVTLANGGTQGVSKYREEQPDLVLMDIQMADMSGIEASKLIREWETETKALRVPILAMTADVEVDKVTRYGEAGMNDLLGKPVNREKLEEAVKGWAVQHNAGPDSPV
jgi:CheY-like chemotaxis protein